MSTQSTRKRINDFYREMVALISRYEIDYAVCAVEMVNDDDGLATPPVVTALFGLGSYERQLILASQSLGRIRTTFVNNCLTNAQDRVFAEVQNKIGLGEYRARKAMDKECVLAPSVDDRGKSQSKSQKKNPSQKKRSPSRKGRSTK